MKLSRKGNIVKTRYQFNKIEANPLFPVHVFPEHVQTLINQLKSISQFETQITSSTLLFVISTLIGNKVKIIVKETWIDTANIWIAIVGKPGTMKTPSMNFILEPLKKIESKYHERFLEDMKHYNQIPKKEREEHHRPKRMQKYSNDPTVEGLIDAMINNPNGMGIYKDELNGFFEEMNRYNSGGNKEFYMSAFSGGQYIKNRKSYDPITIDNVFLSILGSIQPELLKNLSDINISNGMIDRWLYVESDNTIPMFTEDDLPIELKSNYNNYIQSIHEWIPPTFFDWDYGTKNYFIAMINNIGELIQSDETSEKLATYLSKMRTYFARFIGIICTLYKSDIITNTIVDFAADLTEYYINTAKNTFIGFANSSEIDIVWQRENAITEREKVISLLKNFPDMPKSKIAEKCKCSRQNVYKVYNMLNSKV